DAAVGISVGQHNVAGLGAGDTGQRGGHAVGRARQVARSGLGVGPVDESGAVEPGGAGTAVAVGGTDAGLGGGDHGAAAAAARRLILVPACRGGTIIGGVITGGAGSLPLSGLIRLTLGWLTLGLLLALLGFGFALGFG